LKIFFFSKTRLLFTRLIVLWIDLKEIVLNWWNTPLNSLIYILLSMFGLSLKSDDNISIQKLEIPEEEKKLLTRSMHKYYLWFGRQFMRSFLKSYGNQWLIE